MEHFNILDISTSQLKTDYIRIQNRKQFLEEVKSYNPKDPRYLTYWRELKHKVVEGVWGQEFGQWRWMPGSLYFYGNLFLIEHTDESKQTVYIKPFIDDLEWELHYGFNVALGFSGFSLDHWRSCDERLVDIKKDPTLKLTDTEKLRLFNPEGNLKEYVEPLEYLRDLHEDHMGQPLWFNEAKNHSTLGSRGGGKSYLTAGGVQYLIVTDGGKYYNPKTGKFYKEHTYKNPLEGKNHPIAVCIIGAGDTDKSGELCAKVIGGMNALGTERSFGVVGKMGDDDYMPSPLFKDMDGTLNVGNKQKPWRHQYKYKYKGRVITKGTNSRCFHVSYSDKKQGGSQAGAGGRYLFSVVEEQGLIKNSIAVYNSNQSAVSRDRQFGVQWFLGTSGNIDLIEQTRRMFTNPQDYRLVCYRDDWEQMGKEGMIGFFLPRYMTLRQFKDENGNTDYEAALKYIKEIREAAAKADDPSVLREEKMNRPIIPSEMWITNRGYYLPYEEAAQREKTLLTRNTYRSIGTNISLFFDTNSDSGVSYKIDYKADPFYRFPIKKDRPSLDGAVRIFDYPQTIGGKTPSDMYIFTHDPYVSENIDEGGSLGVTHGWISPRYWDTHMPATGPMVCTYIGKPIDGLKTYYENQEKLLMFYGSPYQGLAYEANKGRACREHYMKRNKAHLLFPRPVNVDSQSIFAKRVTEYGLVIGNLISKIQYLDSAYDFLRDKITVEGVEKLVIETLPCIFTTRQIMQYDIDGNFDGVSSLILFPRVISSIETEMIHQKKNKHNPLVFLSENGKVFKQPSDSLIKRLRNNDTIDNGFIESSRWP